MSSAVERLADEWWGRACEAYLDPPTWRGVCRELRAALAEDVARVKAERLTPGPYETAAQFCCPTCVYLAGHPGRCSDGERRTTDSWRKGDRK